MSQMKLIYGAKDSGKPTRVSDHDDNTGGGIVGADDVDVLVVWSGGGQFPLTHVEQTHRPHRLGLDGVQLLGVVSVNGMLQEEAVGVHGAVVLQHTIQHEHHPGCGFGPSLTLVQGFRFTLLGVCLEQDK